MSSRTNTDSQKYHYFQFGLLVTGETEAEHLPKLFKSLMESGWCTFKVLRRVPQLPPDYSQKKRKRNMAERYFSDLMSNMFCLVRIPVNL